MKDLVNKTLKTNWLYLVLSKPKIYLFTLFKHTLIVGIVTLIMSYLYFHSSYNTIKIPAITHTLITVAIGLLLVFRNTTAYDRWSTASKNFYELHAYFRMLIFRVKSLNMLEDDEFNDFKSHIYGFCQYFEKYLKSDLDSEKAYNCEKIYLMNLEKIIQLMDSKVDKNKQPISIDKPDVNFLMKNMNDILVTCASLSRIKNTPIPVAYEMHIKISIFFYICSLPFGLFYDMGLWSVGMVMLVYYIMAGIEIISKEIENPFHGDPNDLPVSKFMHLIKSEI